MRSIPFCVIERPFVIWSMSHKDESEEFLANFDFDFYGRLVRLLVREDEGAQQESEDDQDRKEVASLARMIWHHGVETLVMLLGASIQAPEVPHAYFLRCRTQDVVELARMLSQDEAPRYHRLTKEDASLGDILLMVHSHAPWLNDSTGTVERYSTAVTEMLADYSSNVNRSEYNSIKHGLRAAHGSFVLRVGREEAYGVAPPESAMHTVGSSKDSSTFLAPEKLAGSTDDENRLHFLLRRVTVTWSLERVLCDLQLISMLVANTVGALRIHNGAKAGTIRVFRPAEPEWWDRYEELRPGGMKSSSFGPSVSAKELTLPQKEDVFASYGPAPWRW